MGDSFHLLSTVAAGRADEKRKTLETHSIDVGLHFVQEENPEIIRRVSWMRSEITYKQEGSDEQQP